MALMRVFLERIGKPGETLALDESEARHLLQIRRADPDELVEVLDGSGKIATALVLVTGKQRASVQIREILGTDRESKLDLQLVAALPVQLSTFDALLPGLIQIGCKRIALVATDFGGRIKKDREHYFQRLRAISIQALKQSGRGFLPEITLQNDWNSCCDQLAAENQANWIFHPGVAGGWQELNGAEVTKLGLWIGPEGGFSEREVAAARARNFRVLALGPRFLKLETAALGVCFWAQTQFGDLTTC